MKTCRICGSTKQKSEFVRRSAGKDGFRNECKSCKKDIDSESWIKNKNKKIEQNKVYKKDNKERVLKKAMEYKESHRESAILYNIKKRAKSAGIECDLVVDDIVIPELCPLLGIRLSFNGRMNNRDSSPSADRIDPNKGYIKGNVKIISYRANRIKNNATPTEIKLMASRIDEYAGADDSTKQIKEVCFESRKSSEEKTEIIIETVE